MRQHTYVGFLLGLALLLAFSGAASADEREAPVVTAAFSNAPRAITVAWTHEGNGVYGYAVQFKEQGEWRDVQRFDHTYGQAVLVGLEPSRLYVVRVCAVYDPGGAERECSEQEPPVLTQAAEQPRQQNRPPAPRIVEHHAGPDHLGIKWEAGYNYDSYFVNYTEKAPPGQPNPGPRTIQHDDDGTWGYQRIDNLKPGRTYILQVQGCTETAFGILDDKCWDWSAPYEVQTRPVQLTKPVVTATAVAERQINLSFDIPEDEGVNNISLTRDGASLGAIAVRTGRHIVEDKSARPNTEYRYRLCLTNTNGSAACSDTVTATGKAIAPTAVADVRASVFHTGGGQTNGGAARTRGKPNLSVTWRNTEIPGQFITVEAQDINASSDGSAGGRATGPLKRWIEVHRLSAKDDPTSILIDLPQSLVIANTTLKTYRVCAVVPSLGDAGKVCSQPVNLP